MYRKLYTFFNIVFKRHLRAGYITEEGGAKNNQHPFPNPFLYPIFLYII